MTDAAPEHVVPIISGNGLHRRSVGAVDPADGAYEISPERRAKVQRALLRAARQIAFRLFVRRLRLECEVFFLKARCTLLGASRKLLGYFGKFSPNQ